jgi:tetratricopeptide (TPR) repeat protein
MSQFETLVQECEALIRTGKIPAAAHRLSRLNYAQVPREWRLSLAKLCRRAGLFTSGLKLLTPVIHAPDKKLKVVPTPEELAEYGACLQINGSVTEAIQILGKVSSRNVPETLLYRSWCHFARWEYEESIPLLSEYVNSPLQPYAKLVGSVNLAAALAMVKDLEKAQEVIHFALFETEKGGMDRLKANCLELRAQIKIQSGEFAEAEEDLNEALKILDQAKVQETLFVKRWKAVLLAKKSGHTEPFLDVINEAKKLSRWEIHREAELFSLKINFNPDGFERLVYGTAHNAYQKRVQNELGFAAIATHTILGDKYSPCFDISSGEVDGQALLKPGCKTHQALEVILRDFYRPVAVGGLFAELFPGESFDIFSSPGRVHQIIRRTRKWLSENSLPLSLVESNGHYHIKAEEAFSFRVPLKKNCPEWFATHWQKLVSGQANIKLTASDIREKLKLTQEEYRRFSQLALEQKLLEREYDGGLPLYVFKIARKNAS